MPCLTDLETRSGTTGGDELIKIPDCRSCKNYPRRCAYITPFTGVWCPGLERMANNNKAATEEPINLHDGNPYAGLDYKDVLNEFAGTKRAIRAQWHDKIKEMPVSKKKIITAMLYFGVKASEVIKVLKIPKSTFYRIFR